MGIWLSMPLWRRILATAATLTAAAWLYPAPSGWPLILWLSTSLLAVAGLLLHLNRFVAQVLIRAVWWQGLVLGALIVTDGGGHEQTPAALLALGSGIALLALGRIGLTDVPSGRFNPLAYRGLLITAIAMALADAEVLILWGGIQIEDAIELGHYGHHGYNYLLLGGCGVAMILAVFGLLRLKVWGLLLTLVANVVIAALALNGSLGIPRLAAWALAATAAAQLLLPIPLLVAFFRKTTPRSSQISTRSYGATAAAVVLMLVWCAAMLLWRQHNCCGS